MSGKLLAAKELQRFLGESLARIWLAWRAKGTKLVRRGPEPQGEAKKKELEVYLGRRKVSGMFGLLGAMHTGIKVGKDWYELEGEGEKTSGLRNKIRVTKGRMPAEAFTEVVKLGYAKNGQKVIEDFAEGWLEEHPFYNVEKCNCQHFVLEAVEELGLASNLQNQGGIVGEGKKILRDELNQLLGRLMTRASPKLL